MKDKELDALIKIQAGTRGSLARKSTRQKMLERHQQRENQKDRERLRPKQMGSQTALARAEEGAAIRVQAAWRGKRSRKLRQALHMQANLSDVDKAVMR